jgi:hypothetical protein
VREEEPRLSLAYEDAEVVLPEVDHDLLELTLTCDRAGNLCCLQARDGTL